MNDEIKEILDNIRKIIKSNREDNFNRIIYDCDGMEKLLDYITNLQHERDKFKLRCFKAYKMIFDNYGVLDKYQIDLMEDILKGKEDENEN